MSLAEELLADLEEDDDELEEDMKEVESGDIEEVTEEQQLIQTDKYMSVREIAMLADSERYKSLMEKLKHELESKEEVTVTTPLEADPQYKLIVELSRLAAEIDNEIFVIHKFVRDKYEKRFPELETLVPFYLEYLAAVALLGNDINTKGQNKELLGQILAPATCIVVSVTASTTQGKPLTQEELDAILEACALAHSLNESRMDMHHLVQLRMALIAPNMVALLGADTAAALVSQAGGLAPLARMPACNILVLGAQKKALAGFSSAANTQRAGFLYSHPIVQGVPPDCRKSVVRILANKVALVARPDSMHQKEDGSIGETMLEKVKYRIEKLLEPPAVKASKALPRPLDKSSKKRGGKRVRKMKERLGMTEMRKKANRTNFGELGEDVIQTNIGFHSGQMKSGGPSSGRIRAAVVDQKTRVRMSLTMRRKLEKQGTATGGATSIRSKAAGTASSVTFTPVQGLEIVNPTAKESLGSTSSTYFSSTASFLHVKHNKPKDEI